MCYVYSDCVRGRGQGLHGRKPDAARSCHVAVTQQKSLHRILLIGLFGICFSYISFIQHNFFHVVWGALQIPLLPHSVIQIHIRQQLEVIKNTLMFHNEFEF